MKIINFLRQFKKRFLNYEPSVEVLIYKNNLLDNLNCYHTTYPHLLFAPVLKSNAYGHGLLEIAQILDKEKIAFFVLDSLFEAIILRNNNIKSNILIIGYTQPQNIINSKLKNIAFTIIDLEQLKELSKLTDKKIKIHLKIDTGMHRQGILPEQLAEAMTLIKDNKNLMLEGVCSHLADADNVDESFTKKQISVWKEVVLQFRKNFETIKFFHLCATAGIVHNDLSCGNVIRLGLGLYGINSSPINKLNLKPVLQVQSIITSLKKIKKGEFVGYNATYQADKDTLVATIPMGYFEGIDRRLSNCGFLKIKNNFCPIIGRVSMNITSIDVSAIPDIKVKDKVIVISAQKEDKNSVENIAKTIGTIPWEILVHIPEHLRRKIV